MRPLLAIIILAVLCTTNSVLETEQPQYEQWVKPATIAVAVETPSSKYHRGFTDLQNQPCRPDYDRNFHYTSELISKKEIVDTAVRLGIEPDKANLLAAIAHAESGSQLSCYGDDTKPYYLQKAPNGDTWTYSIGLFQIRLLKDETGSGSCRDEKRLKDNLEQQIVCAWEISSYGKSFRPWTTYMAGKHKQWLNKDW